MSYESAIIKIDEKIISGSIAANITFSNIPGRYRNIILTLMGRGSDSGQQTVQFQVNGDTGANYDWGVIQGNNTSVSGAAGNSQTKAVIMGALAASGDTAGLCGSCCCTILSYAGTTFFKTFQSISHRPFSGAPIVDIYTGQWRSTAAITSITLIPDAGSFAIGTVASLYGLM